MSESRVQRRTCLQGRWYCLLILNEPHSFSTFGRLQVQILFLETSNPDWFFVIFLNPLSQLQGHCWKVGYSCFLPLHILRHTWFPNDPFFLTLYSLSDCYIYHIDADFVFTLLKWLCLHLFLDSIKNLFNFQELVTLTSSPYRIRNPHSKSSKSLSADVQRNKFLFFLFGYSNICYSNVSYSWMVRTPASHPEHPGLYSCFIYWLSGQGFNGLTLQVYGSVPLRYCFYFLTNLSFTKGFHSVLLNYCHSEGLIK